MDLLKNEKDFFELIENLDINKSITLLLSLNIYQKPLK